jgi:hypothetical protein
MGIRRDKFIIISCALLFVLSAMDGALTLWGLSLEVIKEANPFMQLIINKSPAGLMTIKLLLPITLGLVLWKIKRRKFVTYSLWLVLAVYSAVMVLHIYWVMVTLIG